MATIKIGMGEGGRYTVRQKRRGHKDKRVSPVHDVPREDVGEAVRAIVEGMRGKLPD